MRTLLLFLLLSVPVVSAEVVISQVLYDPIDESGSEAVELHNTGSAVDISGWLISTETSDNDAVIPDNTILAANSKYLIADTSWSTSRDDLDWRLADHEETLTMANTNSGVALRNSEGIIDAVGWGDAEEIGLGLFEGTPVEGNNIGVVRQQDSDNNINDFSEQEPAFFSGEIIELVVNVSTQIPLSAVLKEDDSSELGVQLNPVAGSTRTLHLEVFYNGSFVKASWFDTKINLSYSGGIWFGELPLKYWYFGEQEIIISADNQNTSIPVSILELKAVKLKTKTVLLDSSPGRKAANYIEVWNQGNVPVSVSWSGKDLFSNSEKILFENLDIEAVTIEPAETEKIKIELNIPSNTNPGEYRTMLKMGINKI